MSHLKKVPRHDAGQVLQDIYDSEINISIGWMWDRGVEVVIGDHTNGVKERGQFVFVREAISWLVDQIPRHYPSSEFAGKYCRY